MRLLLALLVVLLGAPAFAAGPPSFQEVEESLTCQCGCGLTVHSCNHLQCPSALPLRQEIREQMALGLDRSAILAHFESKYGEKILSSPTTTGFNLAAWTTPFVGLAVGMLVVVFTLLRWRRRSAPPPTAAAPAPAPAGTTMSAHEKTLERELRQFDSRE